MISAEITHRQLSDYNNIGCLICRTPKTIDYVSSGVHINNKCRLISSVTELDRYFGDPLVSPSDYAELIIARKLLERGVLLYISSIDDMVHHNDGFDTKYNGYTKFEFLDSNGVNLVGYKLKSKIKFCQPILTSSYTDNRLTLNISLYLVDRSEIMPISQRNKFQTSNLHKTITIAFEVSNAHTVTDNDIINKLLEYDIELKVINSSNDDSALVNYLVALGSFNLEINSTINTDLIDDSILNNWPNDIVVFTESYKYHYNVNFDDYLYNLDEDTSVSSAYIDAINNISGIKPEPHFLCLDRVLKSKKIFKYPDNSGYLIRQPVESASIDLYTSIQNYVLDKFNSDSNTYVLLNTPNMSLMSLLSYMNDSTNMYTFDLFDNYNADMFFGYSWDFVERSTVATQSDKAFYSAALLTFLNLMLAGTSYITNNVANLNIPNNFVRSSISESSAKFLSDLRCNSMVLFDTGYPSIYGDRSLSMLPNLRYSHVSRNFVRLRRSIREYLETKKFILNTFYNQQSCVNYIRSAILEDFKSNGVLSNYSVQFYSRDKTVVINVLLLFVNVAESISLDFTL